MQRGLSRRKRLRQQRYNWNMRLLFVIVWILFLSIHIFTESLGDLLREQSIQFIWTTAPDFSHFFNFSDLTTVHTSWVPVKLGHLVGFAVLGVLLYRLLGSHSQAMSLSVLFAVVTEVLQLFFGRDGRLYDIVIDSVGVVLEYYVVKQFFPLRQGSSPIQASKG